MLCADVDRS
jgi:hypothetical protein